MPIMVIWQDWEGQDDYSKIVPSLFSQRSKSRILISCTKRLSEGRFRKFHTFKLWRKREFPVLWVSEPWPGNGYGWAPGDQMGPWLLSPPPPRPLLHQEEQDKITLFRFSRIARKVMVGAGSRMLFQNHQPGRKIRKYQAVFECFLTPVCTLLCSSLVSVSLASAPYNVTNLLGLTQFSAIRLDGVVFHWHHRNYIFGRHILQIQ